MALLWCICSRVTGARPLRGMLSQRVASLCETARDQRVERLDGDEGDYLPCLGVVLPRGLPLGDVGAAALLLEPPPSTPMKRPSIPPRFVGESG